MTKVTNMGAQPLVLSGGTYLVPGVETDVENWSKVKAHPITKFYLDAGVLSLDGPDDEPEDDEEDARKGDLIARIKELGGKADKRSSVEKLEALLVEAQQAASAAESASAAE